MRNSTFVTNSTTVNPDNNASADKLAMRLASVIMVLISTYLAVALIVYQGKKACRKKRNVPTEGGGFRRKKFSFTLKRTASAASLFLQVDDGRHLTKLSLLAAVAVTARCVHEVVYAFVDDLSDFVCTMYLKTHIVLYALAIAAIYVFLWTRQRFLYNNPQMVGYNLRFARLLSWLVIIIMVLCELATVVIFMVTRHYVLAHNQCELAAIDVIYHKLPWIFLATVSVTFQIILMFLFVYPLLFHRAQSKECLKRSTRNQNSFMPLVRRIALMAGICIFSDIIALAVTILKNIRLSNYIYDLNLLTDLICIICSFTDWRKRIFSCC